MYQLLFRLLLRHIPPERAHALAERVLHVARSTVRGRALLAELVGPTPSCLATQALGLTFPSPLGAAAGLDKDATWFEDLGALGFGFVEVGTITALPQSGNPPPRVARFIPERALLNRMGFPNPGATVAAQRLARRALSPIVGVNVGRSMAASPADASGDYRSTVRRLAPVADYLVLNVSSPNTPGLRDMQGPERLRSLVAETRGELSEIARDLPLLIKIAPDLEHESIDEIAALAVELELDGIVAVNTTIDYGLLADAETVVAALGGGGVSGAPLRGRAVEVLRRIRRITGDRLVVISVGGVGSAEDVWERVRAGASLVQAYTALIYEGPAWPKQVNRELAQRVRRAGADSIQDLIGTDERDADGPGSVSANSQTSARNS